MNFNHHLDRIGPNYSIFVVIVIISPPGMNERDFESLNVHLDKFKVSVVEMPLHLCQCHDLAAHHVGLGAIVGGQSRHVLFT